MADDDFNKSAVEKAVRKRKELQERLKNTIQEIETLEKFLKTYRDLTAGTPNSEKGGNQEISQATWGTAQQAFEALVVGVLREIGRPMRSGELIEEFKRRGHPLKGNDVRTAWNRLWLASKRRVLTSDRTLGYWIAGEPLTDRGARGRRACWTARKASGWKCAPRSKQGKEKGPRSNSHVGTSRGGRENATRWKIPLGSCRCARRSQPRHDQEILRGNQRCARKSIPMWSFPSELTRGAKVSRELGALQCFLHLKVSGL